ncbi:MULTISPECIES: hypothetical protein [unclassified Pseudomonas]|uniref:Uncharacterized protein n=1 Tax=Pseudomonas sp. MYb327 TaxID=2745230 RepID=A0AAU8E5H5_9PSED
MKDSYTLWSIRGLLFVFDIENARDLNREEVIVSKNVNDAEELSELFDILIRPEFFIYTEMERQRLIDTLVYFLDRRDTFDEIFTKMDTYFEDEVSDRRQFMIVLLGRLKSYQSEDVNGVN